MHITDFNKILEKLRTKRVSEEIAVKTSIRFI